MHFRFEKKHSVVPLVPKNCGNGWQLQAKKEELIYMIQKIFSSFYRKDRSDQKAIF